MKLEQLFCVAGLRIGLLALLVTTTVVVLSGCAGIEVKALKPDGSLDSHAAEGLRYYLPKPYLLVAELPPNIAPKEMSGGSSDQSEGGVQPSSTSPGGSKGAPKTATNQVPSSSSSSPGTASDVSFTAATPNYIIKLIYLPDMQHPMAIAQSSGLTGTSSLSPTLQDGWMLTSMNGSADTKVAETLTGLAAVISSAGSLAKDFAVPLTTIPGGIESARPPLDLSSYYKAESGILRPGLYSFVYNKKGILVGLEPLTLFNGAMNNLSR